MIMDSMGMIPCEDALARLWEFLDGELPGYPQYDFQRAYFEYTRRVREREHAPPSLRRRLLERILEQEANGRGQS